MLFEPIINLGDGVEIQDCIVDPSKNGVFHFCIINHTVQTIILPKGTIMGKLEELYDLWQSAEKFKEEPDAVYLFGNSQPIRLDQLVTTPKVKFKCLWY